MTEMPLDLTDIDLSTAAFHRLKTYPPFADMVLATLLDQPRPLIGTDAADIDPQEDRLAQAWVFQGLDREGRPFRDPEGTGQAVVVLSERREWAGANSHNTASFPALQVLIYADSTRDSEGAPLVRDAARKCKHIFNRIDRLFHNPGNTQDSQRWAVPDMDILGQERARVLDVHSLVRGGQFSIEDVPGTNEFTVRGEAVYNAITD